MPNISQEIIELPLNKEPTGRISHLVIEHTNNANNIGRVSQFVIEVINGVKPCNWVDEAQSDIGYCF